MKKYKILYVFGYGDSPDSEIIQNLKDKLNNKKFEIISDYYAQYNPKEAIYDLKNIIEKNNIDIIIGDNLGGYLVSLLDNDLIKILINPLYNPSLELAEYETTNIDDKGNEVTMKLVPEHIINFYKENKIDFGKFDFDKTYCIFSVNDNYKEYSELCKNIIKQSDPINGIIELLNHI